MRLALFFFFLLALTGTILYGLPAFLNAQIENGLRQNGYPFARVTTTHITPRGLVAEHITLDRDKLDTMDGLTIAMDWPALRVTGYTIETLTLSRDLQSNPTLPLDLRPWLRTLPPEEIRIENLITDYATRIGAIRFTSQITLSHRNPENGARQIQSKTAARQRQLSLEGQCHGTSTAQDINIECSVIDGQFRDKAAQLNRFQGFLTLENTNTHMGLTGTVAAGSGHFFGAALNNIDLTLNASPLQLDMMLRSALSGVPDSRLTIDGTINKDNQAFTTTLYAPTAPALLSAFSQKDGQKKVIPSLFETIKPLTLRVTYMPERRFVGGPLPFEIGGYGVDHKEILSGFVLLYLDEGNLRGSVLADDALIQEAQSYFNLNPDIISEGKVRLDGPLESFLP